MQTTNKCASVDIESQTRDYYRASGTGCNVQVYLQSSQRTIAILLERLGGTSGNLDPSYNGFSELASHLWDCKANCFRNMGPIEEAKELCNSVKTTSLITNKEKWTKTRERKKEHKSSPEKIWSGDDTYFLPTPCKKGTTYCTRALRTFQIIHLPNKSFQNWIWLGNLIFKLPIVWTKHLVQSGTQRLKTEADRIVKRTKTAKKGERTRKHFKRHETAVYKRANAHGH